MGVRTSVEGARGCGFRKPGGLYLVSGGLSEECPLLPIEMEVCPTCGEGVKPARGWTWVDGAKLIPPVEHGTPEHNAVCPLAPEGRWIAAQPDGEIRPGVEGLRDIPAAWEARLDDEGNALSRIGRCGLIWIGEQHYKTPQDFMREANTMGVSRRIVAVPKGFEVGQTWVLLGHRKATEKACSECGDLPERPDAVAVLDMADAPDGLKEAAADALSTGPDPECPACNGTGYEHKPGIITAFKPTAVEYVVKGDETEEEIEALEKRGIELVKVERLGEQEAMEVGSDG